MKVQKYHSVLQHDKITSFPFRLAMKNFEKHEKPRKLDKILNKHLFLKFFGSVRNIVVVSAWKCKQRHSDVTSVGFAYTANTLADISANTVAKDATQPSARCAALRVRTACGIQSL